MAGRAIEVCLGCRHQQLSGAPPTGDGHYFRWQVRCGVQMPDMNQLLLKDWNVRHSLVNLAAENMGKVRTILTLCGTEVVDYYPNFLGKLVRLGSCTMEKQTSPSGGVALYDSRGVLEGRACELYGANPEGCSHYIPRQNPSTISVWEALPQSRTEMRNTISKFREDGWPGDEVKVREKGRTMFYRLQSAILARSDAQFLRDIHDFDVCLQVERWQKRHRLRKSIG